MLFAINNLASPCCAVSGVTKIADIKKPATV